MDAQKKKYFVCGGVLLSLGIVSAALLSCVNLVTAPKIEATNAKKINDSYLEIFPSTTISEKKEVADGKYVDYYVTAYNDAEMTKEKGKIFHGSASGHDGAVEILVGFSGEAKLEKISLVSCNDSYKSLFQKNYLDQVNNGTRDYDDLSSLGATVSSKAVKNVVAEAKELFVSFASNSDASANAWNDMNKEGK